MATSTAASKSPSSSTHSIVKPKQPRTPLCDHISCANLDPSRHSISRAYPESSEHLHDHYRFHRHITGIFLIAIMIALSILIVNLIGCPSHRTPPPTMSAVPGFEPVPR